MKTMPTGTLTADITLPLGEDRDAQSAARGNRFVIRCVCVCVHEEMNPQSEEGDPSLSHSATASCLGRDVMKIFPRG